MFTAKTRLRIRRSLEGCHLRLSFGMCLFEEGYSFDLFGYLIALPFLDRFTREPRELMDSWRVYYFERALWFCWGSKTKSIYMPWMLEHVKHEVMRPDGSWVPYVASYERDKEPDGRWQESYPYSYILRNREVQNRIATVYVERREWRQKWIQWCPILALKRQSIDVSFDDEVGERTGSWKGGTVGCGYEMLNGETAEQTLRRMEIERIFN